MYKLVSSGNIFFDLDRSLSFPCFGADKNDAMTPLFLDWDGEDWEGELLAEISLDLAEIEELLPEAGRAALYETGHGYHAVFEFEIRMEDCLALFELIHGSAPIRSSYGGEILSRSPAGTREFKICHGFMFYATLNGPRIRVGRKPGRDADIKRLTPRVEADSVVLRTHDTLVRYFNHAGHKWIA